MNAISVNDLQQNSPVRASPSDRDADYLLFKLNLHAQTILLLSGTAFGIWCREKNVQLPSPSPDCCAWQQTPVEHLPFASQHTLASSWILLSFALLQPHPKDSKITPCSPPGQGTAQQVEQSNYTGGNEERPFWYEGFLGRSLLADVFSSGHTHSD